MKKLILTLSLVVAASATVFAQGNFVFSTSARYVWDDWSSASIKPDASNSVAFLIGSGTALVATQTGSASVATNTTSVSWTIATAWTSILNDPNYHLATNSTSQALATVNTSSLGAISYLAGSTFGVAGTSASGGSTSVYMIGWNSAYADPFAAAAAGAAVGWSSVFTYAYGSSIGTPSNFSTQGGPVQFGVFAPVPEPSTMVLAGLGGLSLLAFRRKK